MRIVLILAATRLSNGDAGIGVDGGLPWHIPEDLKYFATVTRGEGRNAVVFGRRTYESIPVSRRPLAGRLNIVLSRSCGGAAATGAGAGTAAGTAGCVAPVWVPTLPDAIAAAAGCDTLFIAGGTTLYRDGMAYADEVLLTHVCHVSGPPLRFTTVVPRLFTALGAGGFKLDHTTPNTTLALENGAQITYCFQRYSSCGAP